MNFLHLKYAVEVARAGSINKASNTLLVAQPNISRAVKELEAELGTPIFKRTAKGMFLTSAGEEFISHANKILSQIDAIENIRRGDIKKRQHFSVAVPRASYISQAFAKFSTYITNDPASIYYKEASAMQTVDSVLNNECDMGIIRYHEIYDHHFKSILKEKGLTSSLICEVDYVIIASKNSPLAKIKNPSFEDLAQHIEITHMNLFVPTFPLTSDNKVALSEDSCRKIHINERASQFELLSTNSETYMWASPIPKELLNRYGLIQIIPRDIHKTYKDFLIYKKDYKFSELDKKFIEEIEISRKNNLQIF